MDMIGRQAGPAVLNQIGSRFGLSPDQIASALNTLAPHLAPGIEQGHANGTLPQEAPPEAGSDAATDHGNSVLASILGSKDASRDVAANASAQTGIGVDQIKAVLPQLAGIAAAAFLAHRASQAGAFGN